MGDLIRIGFGLGVIGFCGYWGYLFFLQFVAHL